MAGCHAVAKMGSVVCALVKLVGSFQSGPVPTNKRHAGYPDDRRSIEKPSDEKVIMTGPATLNEETNVRMAFNLIQEATARFSVVHIIYEITANAVLS